jgi:hypothetical protein
MRNNLAGLSAMVVFGAAFLIVYAIHPSIGIALAVSAPLALGMFLIIHTLFPANADLRAYNLDARRRVKKVLQSVDQIQKLAGQVTDAPSKQALLDGCRIIPQILDQTRTRETTSFKVASTAANIQNYLTSVESVLEVYLRIQHDPNFFADPDKQLAAGQEGFKEFDAFALKSMQQLTAGDTAGYQANLETLRPLTLPTIPALGTTTATAK